MVPPHSFAEGRTMARGAVQAILGIAAVGILGCIGTGKNMNTRYAGSGECAGTPYGGVAYDIKAVGDFSREGSPASAALMAADVPFSALGDTLTLAWTLPNASSRPTEGSPPPPAPPASPARNAD
jgi:hypothetical protein